MTAPHHAARMPCRLPCRALLLVLAATLALSSAEAAESRPVAHILNLKGKATLRDADAKERAAATFATVYSGDSLRLEPGAHVTLGFRGDGHLEDVDGMQEVTISQTGCSPADKVKRVAAQAKRKPVLLAAINALPTRTAGGVAVDRSGVTDEAPARLTPIPGSLVLEKEPRFEWPKAEDATRYEVVVSASGRRLWSQTTEAPELAFSRDRPLRDNTLYTWKVFGTFPDKTVKQLHEANFTTANESQRAEAKGLHELAEAPEAPFQAAAALNYERLKLLAEAIPLYENLVKESPETAGFHAALAELYHKAGRVEEAAQAREAAEKLGFDFARPKS